jgi:hypothetical protein
VKKALRASHKLVTWFGVAFSLIAAMLLMASVTLGAWCQDGLRALGYRDRPPWVPTVLGVLALICLLVGPAYLGLRLIGWPGALIGPPLALALIAWLGNW